MAAKKTERGAKKSATQVEARKSPQIFSAEERAAMREHVSEMKAQARRAKGGAEDETAVVLAKIASMPAPDRAMAKRLHEIITTSAPQLAPRLWYGMPAYSKNGQVLCFFQGGYKFKARYGTLGFSDKAALDEGDMWPTSFALTQLNAADEARIAALVKKAAT